MRLLFLGDMVGRTGRTAVWERLPGLIAELKLDFAIVNGENAAGGFGITEEILRETLAAGADVVTTGNHVWDQREALDFAPREPRFLRPANFPAGTPGRGAGVYLARNGARVLVANIMGRVFMHPELDDPFQAGERELAACPLGEQADAAVIDFHAEATNADLQRSPERIVALIEAGVLVQVTARALTRGGGRSPSAELARDLVSSELCHILATDAHSASGWRPPDLARGVLAAAELAGSRAEWMVTDAPAAVLAGEPLPPPPHGDSTARGLAHLRRRAYA